MTIRTYDNRLLNGNCIECIYSNLDTEGVEEYSINAIMTSREYCIYRGNYENVRKVYGLLANFEAEDYINVPYIVNESGILNEDIKG